MDGPPWPMGPGAAHRLHTRSAATEYPLSDQSIQTWKFPTIAL